MRSALEEVEALINKKGRVLLRQSGTENVIRIMVEAESKDKSREYAETIAKAVIAGGHAHG